MRPAVTLPVRLVALVGLVAFGCSSTGTSVASGDAEDVAAGQESGQVAAWTNTVPAVPSPGCASGEADASNGGVSEETLVHDGVDREFTLFVPETDGGRAMPLVLDLHGLGSSGEQERGLSGYQELAERDGVVVAWPQGLGERPAWNTTVGQGTDDIGFMIGLVADLGEQLCIDESRVYASGMSNGGLLSSALACLHPDVFAAVAPVAGYQVAPDCSDPSALILFYGTDDAVLPWAGGVGSALGAYGSGEIPDIPAPEPPDMSAEPGPLAPVPVNIIEWASLAGCADERTEEAVSSEVEHWLYEGCEGGGVEIYVVDGGGHSWPGSETMANLSDPVVAAIIGETTLDISASELAWAYFAEHQLSS